MSADEDHSTDIYERDLTNGTTSLASRGAASCEPSCGNGEFDASFAPGGLTPDGEELFFVSKEQLSAADDRLLARRLRPRPRRRHDEPRRRRRRRVPRAGLRQRHLRRHLQRGLERRLARRAQHQRAARGRRRRRNPGPLRPRPRPRSHQPRLDARAYAQAPSTAKRSSAASRATGLTSSSRAASGSRPPTRTNRRTSTTGRRAAGRCSSVAVGNGAANATYAGETSDGSGVFFETEEQLVPADTDESGDVYERAGGVTTLVSTGPENGNGPFNASLRWVSPQGSSPAVAFTTDEQLTAADEDSSPGRLRAGRRGHDAGLDRRRRRERTRRRRVRRRLERRRARLLPDHRTDDRRGPGLRLGHLRSPRRRHDARLHGAGRRQRRRQLGPGRASPRTDRAPSSPPKKGSPKAIPTPNWTSTNAPAGRRAWSRSATCFRSAR